MANGVALREVWLKVCRVADVGEVMGMARGEESVLERCGDERDGGEERR